MGAYYVYILYSPSKDRLYIGQTKDLDDRLNRHNRGSSKATKTGRPWTLIYFEAFPSRPLAMQRETYLKKLKNRTYLLSLIRPIPY